MISSMVHNSFRDPIFVCLIDVPRSEVSLVLHCDKKHGWVDIKILKVCCRWHAMYMFSLLSLLWRGKKREENEEAEIIDGQCFWVTLMSTYLPWKMANTISLFRHNNHVVLVKVWKQVLCGFLLSCYLLWQSTCVSLSHKERALWFSCHNV